jgi:hypothetical protein
MASAEEMRTWALDQGMEIGTKGRVPAAVREAYNVAHPDPDSSISHLPGRETSSPDYPDGMTDDDFSDPSGPPPDGADSLAETKPGPTSRPRRSFPGLAKGKAKPKAKAKHRGPRLPVDEAVAGCWGTLANLAKPIPPLHRTLAYQAPVAGLLLEDEVRGTVVDRALQPLARLQQHGDTVVALAGLPVLVTAITLHVQRAIATGTEPNPVFMALAGGALRQAVMTMMKVAGPKFVIAAEREAELEAEFGQTADGLVDLLLYGAPQLDEDAPPDAEAAEDDAIRRAQGMM